MTWVLNWILFYYAKPFSPSLNATYTKFPDIHFFHKSREYETRSGVAFYIKDTLKVKLKEDLSTFFMVSLNPYSLK